MTDDIQNNENTDENDLWRSCCLEMDSSAVLFFSQLFISLIVVIFCIYMLVMSKTCEADSLYSGILSLILGSYLPTPSMSMGRRR